MPSGILVRDPNNKITHDINTMTTRVLGRRVVGIGHVENITIPVSPGKRPWARPYTTGNLTVTLIWTGANTILFQAGQAQYGVASTGLVYLLYGEY